VAAFHLAFGPDGCLYVAAPTLSTHDPIYRITPDRLIDELHAGFGRPQGLAFDSTGALYVVEALAGQGGLYRLDVSQAKQQPELVLAAPSLVGVAFAPDGGLVVCSNDTVLSVSNCQLDPRLTMRAAGLPGVPGPLAGRQSGGSSAACFPAHSATQMLA
jgi:hypothetical protein